MDLVVDANILFAALIKKSVTADILTWIDARLYAPAYILDEFWTYEKLLRQKTKRSQKEFDALFGLLQKKITIVGVDILQNNFDLASKICPDGKDVFYFALALQLNAPIWSNDKALKQQDAVIVYSTSEIKYLHDQGFIFVSSLQGYAL